MQIVLKTRYVGMTAHAHNYRHWDWNDDGEYLPTHMRCISIKVWYPVGRRRVRYADFSIGIRGGRPFIEAII